MEQLVDRGEYACRIGGIERDLVAVDVRDELSAIVSANDEGEQAGARVERSDQRQQLRMERERFIVSVNADAGDTDG